uniref:Uncharacterized protein n=1 Tax=Rhizophora mucronata TaxID=61149 RepID=A0A2P2PWS9_RHIMU
MLSNNLCALVVNFHLNGSFSCCGCTF